MSLASLIRGEKTSNGRAEMIRGRVRSWDKGRMEPCQSCGDATGWRTAGKPLCPCCVKLDNPDEYRRRMLAYADELEKTAIAGEEGKQELRLAAVAAIREALERI